MASVGSGRPFSFVCLRRTSQVLTLTPRSCQKLRGASLYPSRRTVTPPEKGNTVDPIVLEFEFRNSTKGAHRFDEVVDENQEQPTVGGLYVRKWQMPDPPQRLHVEIHPFTGQ